MPLVLKYTPILSAFGIKVTYYFLSAVALVVALSWSDTIKLIINNYFPLPNSQIFANIIYSFIITLFLVALINLLPDTTIELPHEQKNKIEGAKTAEDKLNLNKKIIDLEENYNRLIGENKKLRKLADEF